MPEYNENVNVSNNSTLSSAKHEEGATQDYIPLKNIQDGMIITRDNRYLGVIEILPIQFYQKGNAQKLSIMHSFRDIFQGKHIRWMLKIMTDEGDSRDLIANIKKRCPKQDTPHVSAYLDSYTSFLRELPNTHGSKAKRFFFIWEYSGKDGLKSKDIEEIAESMQLSKQSIIQSLEECGNICLMPEDENAFIAEFLYAFFNRNTSKYESIYDRHKRMAADFARFSDMTGIDKQLKYTDLIAPKGLNFMNRNYIGMDGLYYGYIGFSGESWPDYDLPPGWLDRFSYGSNIDIDVVGKLLPHEVTKVALDQLGGVSKGRAQFLFHKGKSKKGNSVAEKSSNIHETLAHMNAGADLYDEAIILTIRAKTAKQLRIMLRAIEQDLKQKLRIEPDQGFLSCEDYFRLTMPFLYTSPVFRRLKHNVLSSKMGCFYPFTFSTINDPNGITLGLTEDDNVLAPDNFNTNYYENANMVILGTSGAGKTFTEQLIGLRGFANGKRCFFIVPAKGYEYRRGCKLTDGLYVQLMPGSKQCINVLEIRPEDEIDRSKISEDTIISNESLLAKKIKNVIVWLQLLIGVDNFEEDLYERISDILYGMYQDFGITNDNNSIFTDDSHTTLKTMPILSDLFERIPEDQSFKRIKSALTQFVHGICSNMNGQTNIDLTNPYIVFDCDENIIGEKLLASFLYIAFDFVNSQVKASAFYKDLVFLDEVWKMMKNAECAKQVQNMVKLIRGYGGGAIIATQELNDFLSHMKKFGMAVINNSAISLLLKMKPTDLQLVQDAYRLTSSDCEKITKFTRGKGMYISNGDKLVVKITPTFLEKETLKDRTAKAS